MASTLSPMFGSSVSRSSTYGGHGSQAGAVGDDTGLGCDPRSSGSPTPS